MENDFDYAILVHPISIVIYFYLFWIFFTSITSTMPLVSFKFLAAKLWFIIPIFFFGVYVFKRKRNIDIFLWSFGISLAIVVFYSSILLASHGFDKNVAHWIMWPFFNDHTAYGAVLAIFTPVFFALGFKPKYNKIQKVLSFLLFAVILIGLYLSASRAAWLSVVIAFGVYIMIIFKIKFRWVFSGLLLILALFFAFQTRIMMKLEQNSQDSAGDNFVKHIQSATNIATDASNLERINRWKSAIRMYEEKPLVGWGPGTYQFVYAPFQHSEDKTIISTNAGNKGNAHSEYLGALSEQGIPGMLLFSLILIMVSLIAIKNHYRIIDKDLKIINLALFLGLITYFAHSFFNNFLDTDKASVPFWGFIAAIVAIDIYAKKSNKNLVNENNNI
jgi:O-antigen ligase